VQVGIPCRGRLRAASLADFSSFVLVCRADDRPERRSPGNPSADFLSAAYRANASAYTAVRGFVRAGRFSRRENPCSSFHIDTRRKRKITVGIFSKQNIIIHRALILFNLNFQAD